ncbi:MAG TPA: phage holin, LLH family [bacterium]|jgi:hypothetical protein|nr:phage holin, LLH family [bacterium]
MEIVLDSILQALTTLLVTAIGVLGGIYIKKIETSIKKINIKNEIEKYVKLINETESTKNLSVEQKKELVKEMAISFADENEIKISNSEVEILIDEAFSSIRKLQNIILKINSGG